MKKRTQQKNGYGKSVILLTLLSLLLVLLQSCSEDETLTPDLKEEDTAVPFDYYTIFSDAEVNTTIVNYYDDRSSDLTLKYFEVQNSADELRPLVILAPGGGWQEYTQVDEIEILADNLAKRGYGVAVVNYTVNQQDGETWLKSIQDFKVAIKYFKKYALDYGIDQENIFSGGWSTGAQLAMYTQHLQREEYLSFDQDLIRLILDPAIEQFGFEPSTYSAYSSEVKGNLLMMPFAWAEDFFDNAGPTLMIANRKSEFNDGTLIWGSEISVGGLKHIGPDAMKSSFEELGLVDGDDLELIITDPSLDNLVSHINYTSLHASHFDEIASFFQRSL